MERREDIRAALQSLLTPGKPREDISLPANLRKPVNHDRNDFFLSESWEMVIASLQNELREIGIDAAEAELITALGEALLSKPGIRRELIADYMLGTNEKQSNM